MINTNSDSFLYRDINFFPNATYKFITCGVQHMNIWKYSGSSLTFSACPLENPKENFSLKSAGFNFDTQDLMQSIDISIIGNVKERKGKDDDDLLSLEVTFLCMCFVQNLIIAGGEDGFVISFTFINFTNFLFLDICLERFQGYQEANSSLQVLCAMPKRNSDEQYDIEP
jgi:hypothetical protein